MTALRYLLFFATLGVLGISVALFVGQNMHAERLEFFGLEYSTNMAWVLLGAAAFGAVIAFVLVLPGRLAVALHAWGVEREVRSAEHDLILLQERREDLLTRHEDLLEAYERLLQRHQRLIAEHTHVVAERDEAQSRLTAGKTAKAVGGRAAPQLLPPPEAARERARASNLAIVSPIVSPVVAPVVAPAVAPVVPPIVEAVSSQPERKGAAPSETVAGQAGMGEHDLPVKVISEAAHAAPAESTVPSPALDEQEHPAPTADMPHPIRRLGGGASQALTALRQRVRDDLARSAALPAALGDAITTTRARLQQFTLPVRLPSAQASAPSDTTITEAPEEDD